MSVRNQVIGGVGILLALWMGLGRWMFGLGGELTWWYFPLITLPYVWLQLWTVRRMRIAVDRGLRVGRAPYIALALSWVSALGFGITVPDVVGGELVSIAGHFWGPLANELAIAFCNPLGIVAFSTMIIALGYAAAAGREPRPEEDEFEEGGMVPHPFERP
ncbi:hypothetical protein [Leucobacter sp. W1478]|uniref:hypothetical protein n=1 Tax=Leucobacter sp. W1478 TaxID=3439065 RepID=UPI003F3F0E4B